MRPIGSGFDVLTPIFGINGFSITAEPLPNLTCSSGISTEEGATLLKKIALEAAADYIVIEGCPLRVLVEIVTDEELFDCILIPTRGDMGVIEKFSILKPELATKPFPPE